MEFTYDFIRMFSIGLFYAGPLLATLALIIIILGQLLGKIEGWSKANALYHAFVTATTLGYGDFHPSKKGSKVLAIMITFVGIMFTGTWSRLHCMLPATRSRKLTTSKRLWSRWMNNGASVLDTFPTSV